MHHQPFNVLFFSAVFLPAFYGFFRIGQLAPKSANSDRIQIHMIQITISKFNHNTTSPPFDILIEGKLSSPFCPVKTLFNYCKNSSHHPGPLICHSSTSPITVSQFRTNLQRYLIFYGPDTSGYKGHSFCIGAACHAVFLTPRFGRLALGNPLHLKFCVDMSLRISPPVFYS